MCLQSSGKNLWIFFTSTLCHILTSNSLNKRVIESDPFTSILPSNIDCVVASAGVFPCLEVSNCPNLEDYRIVMFYDITPMTRRPRARDFCTTVKLLTMMINCRDQPIFRETTESINTSLLWGKHFLWYFQLQWVANLLPDLLSSTSIIILEAL